MTKNRSLRLRLGRSENQISPIKVELKKEITNILLPRTSWQRKILKGTLFKLGLRKLNISGYYNTWAQQQRNHPGLTEELKDMSNGPLISIVVPAYNTSQRYLNDLIYSIISQSYENWELILVNASNKPKPKKSVDACANRDKRIKVITVDNKGISANTNKGIKVASGEYIAFCDHDDILELSALYEVTLRIINERAELIYTDEDKISDDGEIYFDPHYKPDWSPDLFTHVNYINHLTVVKKSLLDKAGLLNPHMDGAQDYDLLLRITDLKPRIVHISKVLYHWRAAANSTARDFSIKKNVTDAGKAALEDHFNRIDIKVKVTPKENLPGFYKLLFEKIKNVSIIITPFISNASLRLYIELLIKRTDCSDIKIELIVPEDAQPRADVERITIKTIKKDSDYLKKAVAEAKFDNLIIINEIALPIPRDWATQLCSVLRQKHILAASPLIVQNNDVVDDCGLVRDSFGNLLALFKDYPVLNYNTPFGNTNWVRNVDALTGAVTAVRKKQFKEFLNECDKDTNNPILEYSLSHNRYGMYNTIYSEVLMDNCAIQSRPGHTHSEYFNDNLFQSGKDYLLYTPEASITNVLSRVAEQEELSI